MECNGSRIILECLKEQGVDTIFGYPGGAILNIYDALYSFPDIKCILTSHEQGAAHAADGYARATGKVGVCLATSGPGATNLVTGIATAYMDSVPMVAITGQVATPFIGKDSFQEVDITGITMPITKHNFSVRKVEDLPDIIRRAFAIAKEGRPGPVLIDIPKDVTAAKYDYKRVTIEENNNGDPINEEELKNAVDIIKEGKKPVIVVGGGCNISDANKVLKEFQNKLKCPVCTTMMGLGAFDGKNPMFTGLVGMHGTLASNKCICESDLVIALGARFSDRVTSNAKTFAKNAKILHIDIDEAEVSKNIKADFFVIGDIKKVLEKLSSRLEAREESEWTKFALDLIKKDNTKSVRINKEASVNPLYVLRKLYELTDGDALITTEVGQNQIWATQGYVYTKPRTFLTSGGLGTMGYGFGAAIGASVGKNKMVFDIAGDGSFRMNCNELATVVRYNLPVKIILLNNSVLGMVRQWQDLFYEKRFSSTTLERQTDFVKIAEGYGALGIRANTNAEVEEALRKAIAYDGPVVVDFYVDENAMATPIVPPGASIENMLTLD